MADLVCDMSVKADDRFAAVSEMILELAEDVQGEQLTPETNLQTELGLDSLDMVNLTSALEERFGITIEDDERSDLETVHDVLRCVSRPG